MIAVDVDAILRAQGADPARVRARSPRLVALAERALREGRSLIAPVVISRRFAVADRSHAAIQLSGGGRLSGPLVAGECAPAAEIVVMAVTIGAALENAVARAMPAEPAFALALDGLGSAAVEAIANAERAAIATNAGAPLSPGMEGWPLERGQRELFALLGEGPHPIRLLESGMMAPRKSLSFVIGIGPAMRSGASHCDFCGSRDRCRHRRAS